MTSTQRRNPARAAKNPKINYSEAKVVTRKPKVPRPFYPKELPAVSKSRAAKRAFQPQTIPDVGYKMMREWVDNHYTLKKCFLIPREQRTYVQPHKWDFSSNLLNGIEGDYDHFAVKVRPSVNRFLSIGRPIADSLFVDYTNGQEHECKMPSFQAGVQGKGITFDENYHMANGDRLVAGLEGTVSGFRYLAGDNLKSGCKMYQGGLEFDSRISFSLTNPDNAAMSFFIKMLRIDFAGTFTEELVGGGVFNVNGNSTLNMDTNIANPAVYIDIAAWGFALEIENSSTIGICPSGLNWKVGFTTAGAKSLKPLVWRDYSVWELLEDPQEALKRQYESSNFHCFTAVHATFTNTQAKIYKGGSVQAAQVSGRGEDALPHTFTALDRWIGNRTYDTNTNKDLTKGLHWNYRWEKVQDTFFISRDAEEGEANDRPSMVATFIAPPRNDGSTGKQFAIQLTGAVMIEYITEIRDAPVFLSPADTVNLLARYCAVRADMPCLMENPDHWATLKDNVKKIMQHPVTKAIVKDLATAGLTLLMA